MSKSIIFAFVFLISILGLGCGSAATSNSNTTPNANVAASNNAKDIPPGMSTSPVPPSANTTPGIPDANSVKTTPGNGATAPGINPKTAIRTVKPGEKIPGIPDAATLKKQMSQPVDPSKLPPEFRGAAINAANAKQQQMTKKP